MTLTLTVATQSHVDTGRVSAVHFRGAEAKSLHYSRSVAFDENSAQGNHIIQEVLDAVGKFQIKCQVLDSVLLLALQLERIKSIGGRLSLEADNGSSLLQKHLGAKLQRRHCFELEHFDRR